MNAEFIIIKQQAIKRTKMLALTTAICIGGCILGLGAGHFILKLVIRNPLFSPFLIYRPSRDFFASYRLVNSTNELERLAGYYALRENGLIDIPFLEERYSQEESPVTRRAIVWVLGASKNVKNVTAFFEKIYPSATDSVRQEMLRSLKSLDESSYNEFLNRNKVPQKNLSGI